MRELPTADEEHLRQVTQAQLVSESPEHHLEDDVSGNFEIVEGRTRALIELALTFMAAEDFVSEIGRFMKVVDLRRAAVGAVCQARVGPRL